MWTWDNKAFESYYRKYPYFFSINVSLVAGEHECVVALWDSLRIDFQKGYVSHRSHTTTEKVVFIFCSFIVLLSNTLLLASSSSLEGIEKRTTIHCTVRPCLLPEERRSLFYSSTSYSGFTWPCPAAPKEKLIFFIQLKRSMRVGRKRSQDSNALIVFKDGELASPLSLSSFILAHMERSCSSPPIFIIL